MNNGFRFSKSKTQCVLFCLCKKMHNDLAIKLEGIKIAIVDEHEFLGVIFDEKLSSIFSIETPEIQMQ